MRAGADLSVFTGLQSMLGGRGCRPGELGPFLLLGHMSRNGAGRWSPGLRHQEASGLVSVLLTSCDLNLTDKSS